MAVSLRVADLIHHAVIHVFERGGHPGHIQLVFMVCAAHFDFCWGVQQNCGADSVSEDFNEKKVKKRHRWSQERFD